MTNQNAINTAANRVAAARVVWEANYSNPQQVGRVLRGGPLDSSSLLSRSTKASLINTLSEIVDTINTFQSCRDTSAMDRLEARYAELVNGELRSLQSRGDVHLNVVLGIGQLVAAATEVLQAARGFFEAYTA